MLISILINTHNNLEITEDTLDSIQCYLTNDILVITDGKSDLELNFPTIRGFDVKSKPFKNVAYGLKSLYEMFPDSTWFGYIEYDCLVTSDYIKSTLKKADEDGVWFLANDGYIDKQELLAVENIIGEKLNRNYKVLGCCNFFHKNFMKKLAEIKFFDKFLEYCSLLDEDLPGFYAYDISEHIYPSLARHYGQKIAIMANWFDNEWHGNYRHYPMRFSPKLTEADNFPEASIIHPLKTMCSIRQMRKKERECLKSLGS